MRHALPRPEEGRDKISSSASYSWFHHVPDQVIGYCVSPREANNDTV